MNRLRYAFLLLLLSTTTAVFAQDEPTIELIRYGMQVEGTISDEAFFDWWQFDAAQGDSIRVQMQASDGLAPLIGITSIGGDLLARSDDGAPDGMVELRFEIPADGRYTLVATRVGIESGTTTGSYSLNLTLTNPPVTRDPQYQEVTFRCRDTEAATVATIDFRQDEGDPGAYRISIYGLDGFTPALRVQSSEQGTDFCHVGDGDAGGAIFARPGEAPVTSTEAESAQLVINTGGVDLGDIRLMIGGLNRTPGRYFAVIEGFNIEPSVDTDTIGVRLGALPGVSTPLLVYMIGVGDNSRLDPRLAFEDGAVCDDAGRRGCDDVPGAQEVSVTFPEGGTIAGDRFDAGLRIEDRVQQTLTLSSFAGRTRGDYAFVLIGELP